MITIKKCDMDCENPCGCSPRVIASRMMHAVCSESGSRQEYDYWYLDEYQGDGVGTPNTYWRLIELDYCNRYDWGEIDENGKLVGLQDYVRSGYCYCGYMEIQQGCYTPPEGDTSSPSYSDITWLSCSAEYTQDEDCDEERFY